MISNGVQERAGLIADAFYEGCRQASVVESLEPEWRKELTEGHSSQNGTSVTATSVKYGKQVGWFTVLQLDGVFRADFWTPELTIAGNPARKAIDVIGRTLGTVLPHQKILVRGKAPYEFLAEKGWTREEIQRIRR